MRNKLWNKHPVCDLKFAFLQSNQNRYKDAYEEVRFRANRSFFAATAVHKDSQEKSRQDTKEELFLLETPVDAYVRAVKKVLRS